MGDINQAIYLDRYLDKKKITGPILEIGSLQKGNTTSFRDVWPANEYIGLDLENGNQVDVVHDLTQGIGPLPINYYDLIICCSVLEHVAKPWLMAENIERLLKPGGYAYISVPWVWRYHPHPDDYFRFSWRGIMQLFSGLECMNPCYSTLVENEIIEIKGRGERFDNDKSEMFLGRKHLPYLMVNMICQKVV